MILNGHVKQALERPTKKTNNQDYCHDDKRRQFNELYINICFMYGDNALKGKLVSTADIKYFNLLVHYGVDFQNNFSQLLIEALAEVLGDPDQNTLQLSNTLKIFDLHYFEHSKQMFLTGLLYKSGVVKWESVPNENDDPILDPGTKKVMPYARFLISIADHRLFWITKRGLTKSPSANDFCFFVKKKCLPILREKFKLDAQIEWEAIKDELKEDGFKSRSHYVNTYLKENKLTSKLFEVRAVAEVSEEVISTIIDDKKYIIKSATFFPHMNNVTDDDCEELFTTADKIAKEAESEATITLKPKSNEDGVKKDAIKDILAINQQHRLLKFSLSLKNIRDKKQKPLVISNAQDTDINIAKTGVVEGEVRDNEILSSIISKFPDIVGLESVSEENKAAVEAKVGKIDVE